MMNKEEAKQKLCDLAFPKFDTIPEKLNLVDVLSIVEQIDEPQAKESLGVLLVDMPGRGFWKYNFLRKSDDGRFLVDGSDKYTFLVNRSHKLTEAEAKEKYPSFKWVSLEELEKQK